VIDRKPVFEARSAPVVTAHAGRSTPTAL